MHLATATTLRHAFQKPAPAPLDQTGMVRDLREYDRAFGLDELGRP